MREVLTTKGHKGHVPGDRNILYMDWSMGHTYTVVKLLHYIPKNCMFDYVKCRSFFLKKGLEVLASITTLK